MNKFLLDVIIRVEISALDSSDAVELAEDIFGEGEAALCDVKSFKVIHIAEA